MIRSMTAFASQQGFADGTSWTWELRSVNGRGLDAKLRLPDGVDGVEGPVRAALKARLARGNVTAGLRLQRNSAEGALQLDEAALDAVLGALDAVQERAFAKGVTLGQPTAADVLASRGVWVVGPPPDAASLTAPVLQSFEVALDDLIAMREAEGAQIATVFGAQVDEIETLIHAAQNAAAAREAQSTTTLKAALARVMGETAEVDPDRLAQEIALIAVKSDITEELDRLRAHVAAARDLLGAGGPVGRKLDFLMQEFNREANTLCSKAQDTELTQIGLALKVVIDQMREQVQNVE